MQVDLNKSQSALPTATGFSAQEFRAALGLFATGVTIVTTLTPEGVPVGLTVNSFNSVSLTPPLVLWSQGAQAATRPIFSACSHYAIHVLAADQRELALRFASRAPDRFDGVTWTPGRAGVPLLAGCAAVFECANLRRHDEGDHVLYIGEVVHCRPAAAPVTPLIFHGGKFYTELPL